ncbi:MAG: hypothetical protein DME05_13890 [Candidatus Rokuibacteriota bacterium]|nr:MAG: hypothetical protein DME05_13890 [Candidatus Rokubacteria bacterium]PYN77677.1 MAG: hypothetical protein DMD97_08150 [Candidatus Rokubacteria bacterium]
MRALRTVLAGGAIAIASIVLWGAIPEEMLAQDAAPSLAGNEVLKVLGEDVVGAPESAPPLNDPGRVARWEPGEWRYRVMTGSRKGQTEQESLEPIGTTARGESWKRTVGQDYTLFLRQSADGSLVLPSQVAHIHSALVYFDPPLSYLLAGMNPGESRTFDGRMEVYSSKDPSVRWYGGRIRATTVYAGVYQVRTPAGAFRATLIRTEYRIDIFAVVSVRDTLYTFYADGVGKVAEAEHRRISAVGLFNSDTYIGKLLLSFTPLVPAAPPAKVESP